MKLTLKQKRAIVWEFWRKGWNINFISMAHSILPLEVEEILRDCLNGKFRLEKAGKR